MKSTTDHFDKYFQQGTAYNANDIDAVVSYFQKRGFEETAAINTAVILLQQAYADKLPIFKLLDTLKGLSSVQLSNIVAQILNVNRSNTSTLGYAATAVAELFDQRNIII